MSNYLKQVIIRIDLPNEFEFAKLEIPIEMEKLIIPIFPIPEPRNVVGKHFQFSQKVVELRDLEKKEWHYFEKNKEKELIISENTLFIDYSKYQNFENLKKDWFPIINKLFELYPEIQITRFGLRYINHIDLEHDSTNWDKIINSNLLHNFQLGLENISRGLSVINITQEDLKIIFNYGIHNPDFPAPIKKNIFILDYDVYYEGLMTKREIIDNTTKFHEKVRELHRMAMVEEDDPR